MMTPSVSLALSVFVCVFNLCCELVDREICVVVLASRSEGLCRWRGPKRNHHDSYKKEGQVVATRSRQVTAAVLQ